MASPVRGRGLVPGSGAVADEVLQSSRAQTRGNERALSLRRRPCTLSQRKKETP